MRPIAERLRRLRERRGECLECGTSLLRGCAHSARKQAAAEPLYDWDGTLVPRIPGAAAAYKKRLAQLGPSDRTPLAAQIAGSPVDIATARPPLFHRDIREAAKRMGLNIRSIEHAPDDKVETVRRHGRPIVDDDAKVLAAVRAALGARMATHPDDHRVHETAKSAHVCADVHTRYAHPGPSPRAVKKVAIAAPCAKNPPSNHLRGAHMQLSDVFRKNFHSAEKSARVPVQMQAPVDPMAAAGGMPPGGGMPPMDPAMMGGAMPPVDPAMMGGAPMDPAAMGGAPMDPAMMGGAPAGDPAAGGMPADPAMAGVDPAMLEALLGGAGGAPAAPASSITMSVPELLQLIETVRGSSNAAAAEKPAASKGNSTAAKIDQIIQLLGGSAQGAAPGGEKAAQTKGPAKALTGSVYASLAGLGNALDAPIAGTARALDSVTSAGRMLMRNAKAQLPKPGRGDLHMQDRQPAPKPIPRPAGPVKQAMVAILASR